MSALAMVGRALRRGAAPRLLGLFVLTLLVPTLLSFLPLRSFLAAQLEHVARPAELSPTLDSFALVQLLTRTGDPGVTTSLVQGFLGAAVVSILLSPFLTGSACAQARSSTTLTFRQLMLGGADWYGRMLRMMLVALVPYALALVVAAIAMKLASRVEDAAVFESSASRAATARNVVIVLALFLAQTSLDAGRAHLVAQPERRSTFLAWWSGVRLLARSPVRALGIAAAAKLATVLLVALVVGVRMRVPEGSGIGIAAGFVIGQLAVVAVGWGRASRLMGLTELVRSRQG